MKYLFSCFIFFICFFTCLFSSYDEKNHIEQFSQLLEEENFQECLKLLDQWESFGLFSDGTILGLRAAVCFSLGNIKE